MSVSTKPQLMIPTETEALSFVNRWLHQHIGTAVHVTTAVFDPVSYYWHLPVEMAYPDKGTLGVIGDLYLHAVRGTFAGLPAPDALRQHADALAALHKVEA